jgi:dTDP-glucose pyrophosphorylase
MNIVIPMAGAGSRFAQAGYAKPKPFIDVAGKPMIVRVLENLACSEGRYFLIARKEHMDQEVRLVRRIEQEFNANFVPIEGPTEGAACTILYARQWINNDEPLMVANSDQIVDMDVRAFIADCAKRDLDGSILTFKDNALDPKWSFVKLGVDGLVMEVQEKKPISEYASVGIYLYRRGRDFVDAAIDMFIERDCVNNEYYTCPTYNHLIRSGKKVGIFNIAISEMHGLGTPQDLEKYLACMMCSKQH